jgi:hypothetical protein
VLPAFKPVPKLPAQKWADEVVKAGICEEAEKPYLHAKIAEWYEEDAPRRRTALNMADLTNRYKLLLKELREPHPVAVQQMDLEASEAR